MATVSPIMRQLGCLRPLMRTSESIAPTIMGCRSISTAYTPKPEPTALPNNMPDLFQSQLPARMKADQARKPLKVYTPPPSSRKTCKDPIGTITQSQLSALDPTGDRKALFDYRRNPRSVKPGDILRVIFRNGDPFSGVCLSIRLRGVDTSFLLRNQLTRVGVEMSVKVFSPEVQSVEIVQRSEKRRRRARLYYLRQPRHDIGSVENTVSNYLKKKSTLTGQRTQRR